MFISDRPLIASRNHKVIIDAYRASGLVLRRMFCR